jgi:type II secretory pathway component PulF
MPDFAYIARDRTGQRVTGTLTAGNEREVLAQLATKALFPLHVDSSGIKVAKQNVSRRVKPLVMATFYSQLAGLLKSGVPLMRALNVLRGQSSNAALTETLSQVHDLVQDGVSLSEAMARFPNSFSEMAVNMVRAGSEGGFLEEALSRVAHFTEQQADLKSKTIGALIYPLVMGGIGTLVVTGLLIFVVPNFEKMFDKLRAKGELPVITEWLLVVSNFLGSYWYIMIGLLIAAYLATKKFLDTEPGKMLWDRWIIRVPGAGPILLDLAVARFTRVLGTLLHNGVPIIRSLDISSAAAGNRVLAGAIQAATVNISAGQSLAKPLAASGHFPVTISEMISVAEEANNLETVLIEISDSLEKQTWRKLDIFIKLLEPLMIVLLAGMVLCVVVALILPMMKMGSAL